MRTRSQDDAKRMLQVTFDDKSGKESRESVQTTDDTLHTDQSEST